MLSIFVKDHSRGGFSIVKYPQNNRPGAGLWSRGYDVAFTRRRSPVQIRPGPPFRFSLIFDPADTGVSWLYHPGLYNSLYSWYIIMMDDTSNHLVHTPNRKKKIVLPPVLTVRKQLPYDQIIERPLIAFFSDAPPRDVAMCERCCWASFVIDFKRSHLEVVGPAGFEPATSAL